MESQYESNLSKLTAEFGENHPKVAEALNVLGLYHHHMSRNHELSLQYHERALNIFTNCENSSVSRQLSITTTDVGNVYRSMGKKEKASEFYNKALDMVRQESEGRWRDFWIYSITQAIESLSTVDHNNMSEYS